MAQTQERPETEWEVKVGRFSRLMCDKHAMYADAANALAELAEAQKRHVEAVKEYDGLTVFVLADMCEGTGKTEKRIIAEVLDDEEAMTHDARIEMEDARKRARAFNEMADRQRELTKKLREGLSIDNADKCQARDPHWVNFDFDKPETWGAPSEMWRA